MEADGEVIIKYVILEFVKNAKINYLEFWNI